MRSTNGPGNDAQPIAASSWRQVVARYNRPDWRRSTWQLVTTLGAYAAAWYLMYLSLRWSFWVALPLVFVAAGLLVRLFIIFHDCGHGSFYRSRRLNAVVGTVLGVLTFTPYRSWHADHAMHHATVGDLDRRGIGDVRTLTAEEYLALPKLKRMAYRVYRNPFVIFGVGSLYVFLVRNRVPRKRASPREKLSVHATNLAILGTAAGLCALIGLRAYLLIQLPVLYAAAAVGVWLFYLQHQFTGVYWYRHDSWDYTTVALRGCSFLKLPRILNWFTGNIGFHHIHHLSPRIPNYNLARCHQENPLFAATRPITLRSSVACLRLGLWNETDRRLIRFDQLRA